ncbi:hypothetical protein NtRootD5_00960 [Arthrobacter sp. NtRootD5]|nr:hypothetical protein NtRootD5_00960 [Arthrobacter sp. NtRootD5]
MHMSNSDLIALVAGVVTLVGAVITALQYRRSNPKSRISADVRAAPIVNKLGQGSGWDKLVVQHSGNVVQNPYVLIVTLESTGRADIQSSRFDAGKPLILECGAPIIALLSDDPEADLGRVNPAGLFRAEGDNVLFGPALLKKGRPAQTTVLLDGRPKWAWNDRNLIDVKIQPGRGRDAVGFLRGHFSLGTIAAIATVGALLVAVATFALQFFGPQLGIGSRSVPPPVQTRLDGTYPQAGCSVDAITLKSIPIARASEPSPFALVTVLHSPGCETSWVHVSNQLSGTTVTKYIERGPAEGLPSVSFTSPDITGDVQATPEAKNSFTRQVYAPGCVLVRVEFTDATGIRLGEVPLQPVC